MDVVTEYLKLGLRFDRVVDGFVDAYIGDPALRQVVANEPEPDPAQLSIRAAQLSTQVRDAGLTEARSDFLTAHLDALAVAGRRLAGESMSFIDEVHAYFQVRISEIDTDVYAQAHDDIARLLDQAGAPPNKDLAVRLGDLRAREACPPELVEPAVRAVAAALRSASSGRPDYRRKKTSRSTSSAMCPGRGSTTTWARTPLGLRSTRTLRTG